MSVNASSYSCRVPRHYLVFSDKGRWLGGLFHRLAVPILNSLIRRTEDDISKNVYKRHAQSFTASSLEMLLSAAYQVSHPLPTRASPTGHFSSRFITVCITGNAEGAAEPIAWQATEQAEAMVKAGIVEASVDPGTVRVRRPGKDEYIPEVFYR